MKNSDKTLDKSKIIDFQERHQAKQKKIQRQMSYGALIILVVVVVSFVAWPILSKGVSSNQDLSFGSYRGQPITYSAEYGLFTSNLHNMLNQFGVDSTSSDTQQRSVFERAFFSTVNQYGHYFYLYDRGNDVSRKEANTLIYNQFIKDGKLNRGAWNQLQNDPNRLKNAQNLMTYAAAYNIWNDIYDSMDLINHKELELLVPTLGDIRKVSYLYNKIADFPETEVKKFYDKNRKLFDKQFLRRIVVDTKANQKKVEDELKNNGNFGELAQLYSHDVYSQDQGEYGNQFYYEMLDFFTNAEGITEELATEWSDKIFGLKQGEYAGPYKLNQQWYFFQVKTQAEIEAEKIAEKQKKVEQDQGDTKQTEASIEEPATELTGFASVASVVRSYIEQNEISLITDYFRKNLEILKSRAESANSLADLDQSGLEVEAHYNSTPEPFGFSYSGKDNGTTSLYKPLSSAFTEDGLADSIGQSKLFFENIFSLQLGKLSEVMLLGMEKAGNKADQQYVAFFRLDEARESNVQDFVPNQGDGLDSKKSLYNYYLSSLLTSGLELEFLSNRNLKQRFGSAYNTWSAKLPQS